MTACVNIQTMRGGPSCSSTLFLFFLSIVITISDFSQAFTAGVIPTINTSASSGWRTGFLLTTTTTSSYNPIDPRNNGESHRLCPLLSQKSSTNKTSSRGRGGNLSVAATSFLRAFWKGLTLPFPSLRKIFLDTEKQTNLKIGLRFRESVLGVLLYLLAGVLAYHTVLEKTWSIVDSLYFTTVCFTTVGYGDVCPSNAASKLFTCLFGLGGIVFLGSAIATLSSKVVEAESSFAKSAKRQSKKRLMHVFEDMPHVLKQFRRKSKKDQTNHFRKARTKVMSSLHMPHWLTEVKDAVMKALPSLLIILGGGATVNILNGGCAEASLIDAIYFSLVTASTIGFGDAVPKSRNAKIFAIFYIPLAVAAAGDLLSGVATRMMERRQREVYKQQFEKDLTISNLNAMDYDGDGKITREEYVQFMLIEMGVVEKDELVELDQQFDRLDKDGSGYLSTQDLQTMAKYRGVTITE